MGARICKSVASFSAVVIFSRELGASPLGVYYPFIAVLGVLGIPANFGLSNATQKRISEGEDSGSYLGSSIALRVPLIAVVAASIVVFEGY